MFRYSRVHSSANKTRINAYSHNGALKTTNSTIGIRRMAVTTRCIGEAELNHSSALQGSASKTSFITASRLFRLFTDSKKGDFRFAIIGGAAQQPLTLFVG